MNITLPDDLAAYVDQRVSAGGYGSTSDYVQALIEREQSGVDHLRQLLLEGAASPPAGPADEAWFQELGQLAAKHARR